MTPSRAALLPGTLDTFILEAVSLGRLHPGIGHRVEGS